MGRRVSSGRRRRHRPGGHADAGLLRERGFPASEIVPFASERSVGRELDGGLVVRGLDDESIQGFDLALFSAGGSTSGEWAPKFAAAGATVIDNSSRWRMQEDVPLVVRDRQAVVEQLLDQSHALLHEREIEPPSAYAHQIAFNALPHAGSFAAGEDHTDEERKLIDETRKILDDPSIRISATCVRVPVLTGHSEAVNVQTRRELSPERARELLAAAPGVTVLDDPDAALYPLAIDAAGKDDVFVGRIRRDPGHERALDMWIVADNLRKGAATNAVQLAELLHERGLVRRLRAPSAA